MKKKVSNISAAVLAGGKNSRMLGLNKAFIQINNTSIIQRTIGLLKEIFDEIILVTNSTECFGLCGKGVVITEDIIKDIGPLGGIYSALSITSKDAVFFVACDMPFLHNGLIRQQLEYFKTRDCNVLVPRVSNFIEPLHSIYKKNLADDIVRFVKENGNYSIRSFLKTVNVYYWDLEDTFFHRNIFRNVNTEEDVRIIQGLGYEDKIKGKIKGLA